eukprot:31058-Pelagococcus_subviridis.AAC.12
MDARAHVWRSLRPSLRLRPELKRVRDERVDETELEPVQKPPVLPGLDLVVVRPRHELEEPDAKRAGDDVVDPEHAERQRDDVRGVESREGADGFPQRSPALAHAEVQLDPDREGREDGRDARLPRPRHRGDRQLAASSAAAMDAPPRGDGRAARGGSDGAKDHRALGRAVAAGGRQRSRRARRRGPDRPSRYPRAAHPDRGGRPERRDRRHRRVAARKPKSSRPRLYLSRAKGRRRRAARARARACYAAIAIRARVRRSGEPNDPRRACGGRRARSSADGAARRAYTTRRENDETIDDRPLYRGDLANTHPPPNSSSLASVVRLQVLVILPRLLQRGRERELHDRSLPLRDGRHAVNHALRADDDDAVRLRPPAPPRSLAVLPLRLRVRRVVQREHELVLRLRVQRDVLVPVHRAPRRVHAKLHGDVRGLEVFPDQPRYPVRDGLVHERAVDDVLARDHHAQPLLRARAALRRQGRAQRLARLSHDAEVVRGEKVSRVDEATAPGEDALFLARPSRSVRPRPARALEELARDLEGAAGAGVVGDARRSPRRRERGRSSSLRGAASLRGARNDAAAGRARGAPGQTARARARLGRARRARRGRGFPPRIAAGGVRRGRGRRGGRVRRRRAPPRAEEDRGRAPRTTARGRERRGAERVARGQRARVRRGASRRDERGRGRRRHRGRHRALSPPRERSARRAYLTRADEKRAPSRRASDPRRDPRASVPRRAAFFARAV